MPLPAPTPQSRAVVTGASSGIGESLAMELASRGYNLMVVARRVEKLEQLKTELESKHGVIVDVRQCDLSKPDQRDPLVEEIAGTNVSILCNNAGIATFGPLADQDFAYEKDQLQLNAVAVHDLIIAVLPGMLERGEGGILNVGSAAGNMAIPNNATYAASKAFVNTMSESLRGEVAAQGVNVTLLAPGPVKTEFPPEEEQSAVDKLVPNSFWIDCHYTAKLSIDSLAANRMRVVPGIIGKGMSVSGTYLPRVFTSKVVGKMYEKFGLGT